MPTGEDHPLIRTLPWAPQRTEGEPNECNYPCINNNGTPALPNARAMRFGWRSQIPSYFTNTDDAWEMADAWPSLATGCRAWWIWGRQPRGWHRGRETQWSARRWFRADRYWIPGRLTSYLAASNDYTFTLAHDHPYLPGMRVALWWDQGLDGWFTSRSMTSTEGLTIQAVSGREVVLNTGGLIYVARDDDGEWLGSDEIGDAVWLRLFDQSQLGTVTGVNAVTFPGGHRWSVGDLVDTPATYLLKVAATTATTITVGLHNAADDDVFPYSVGSDVRVSTRDAVYNELFGKPSSFKSVQETIYSPAVTLEPPESDGTNDGDFAATERKHVQCARTVTAGKALSAPVNTSVRRGYTVAVSLVALKTWDAGEEEYVSTDPLAAGEQAVIWLENGTVGLMLERLTEAEKDDLPEDTCNRCVLGDGGECEYRLRFIDQAGNQLSRAVHSGYSYGWLKAFLITIYPANDTDQAVIINSPNRLIGPVEDVSDRLYACARVPWASSGGSVGVELRSGSQVAVGAIEVRTLEAYTEDEVDCLKGPSIDIVYPASITLTISGLDGVFSGDYTLEFDPAYGLGAPGSQDFGRYTWGEEDDEDGYIAMWEVATAETTKHLAILLQHPDLSGSTECGVSLNTYRRLGRDEIDGWDWGSTGEVNGLELTADDFELRTNTVPAESETEGATGTATLVSAGATTAVIDTPAECAPPDPDGGATSVGFYTQGSPAKYLMESMNPWPFANEYAQVTDIDGRRVSLSGAAGWYTYHFGSWTATTPPTAGALLDANWSALKLDVYRAKHPDVSIRITCDDSKSL